MALAWTANSPAAEQRPDHIPETGTTIVEAHLLALRERWRELPPEVDAITRARLRLDIARALVALDRGAEAWAFARPAFETVCESAEWALAAEICDVLYRADQPGSLSALGQGIWLAVTFPVDPAVSIPLLQCVVEDTPDDADGAAVAAATAVFLATVRAPDERRENLVFLANQMLGTVARRHGGVQSTAQFEHWVERLELDRPDRFLPRLRQVIDALVGDDWWLDPDSIRATLPVN